MSDLTSHLKLKHRNEKDVAYALTQDQITRNRIFLRIRNLGMEKTNRLECTKENPNFERKRSSTSSKRKTVMCSNCKTVLLSKNLARHNRIRPWVSVIPKLWLLSWRHRLHKFLRRRSFTILLQRIHKKQSIIIFGPANTGKSTLINWIAGLYNEWEIGSWRSPASNTAYSNFLLADLLRGRRLRMLITTRRLSLLILFQPMPSTSLLFHVPWHNGNL